MARSSSLATLATLRGRVGAYRLHSLYDTQTVSLPGRRAAETALRQRLLEQVDPDRTLSHAERERRLEYARKAHFAELALKSAQKRRAKKGATS